MVFKKYIYKHGKKIGPYYYQNIRSPDGKVKSVYLGANPLHHTKHKVRKPLFFLIIVLLMILILGSLLFFLQNKAYLRRAKEIPPDFDVDQILLKVLVRNGEYIEKSIRVMNTGAVQSSISIEVFGLSDIVKADASSFSVKPGQTKIVGLNFSSFLPEQKIEERPGIYVGKLIVKSEKASKEIPIVAEIETKNVLFDMNLNPVAIERRVKQGSDTTIEVRLFNLESIESVNVDVEYFVKDMNGNTIMTESETVVVRTQASFFKTISVPKNLKPGTYVFAAESRFGISVGTSSYLFEVTGPEVESSFAQFCKNSVLCLGLSLSTILLLFALTAYFYFYIGAYLYERFTGLVVLPKKARRKKEEKEEKEGEKEWKEAGGEERKGKGIMAWLPWRLKSQQDDQQEVDEQESEEIAEISSALKEIYQVIGSSKKALENSDANEANRLYHAAIKIYVGMKNKEKHEVYDELTELYHGIKKLNKEKQHENIEKKKELEKDIAKKELLQKERIKRQSERKEKLKNFFHSIGWYKTSEEKRQIALEKEKEKRQKESERQQKEKGRQEKIKADVELKQKEELEERQKKEQRLVEKRKAEQEEQRKQEELREQKEQESKRKQAEKERKGKEEQKRQEELIKQREIKAKQRKKQIKNFLHKIGFYKTPEEKRQIALQREKERQEKIRREEEIQKLEDLREQKEKLTEKKRREEKLRQESGQKKEIEQKRREDEKITEQKKKEEGLKKQKEAEEAKKKLESERQKQEQKKVQRQELISQIKAKLGKGAESAELACSRLKKLESEKRELAAKSNKSGSAIKEIEYKILDKYKEGKELTLQKNSLSEKHRRQAEELNKSAKSKKKDERWKIKEMRIKLSAMENSLMKELEEELSRIIPGKKSSVEKWKRLEIKAKLALEEKKVSEELKNQHLELAEQKKSAESKYKESLQEIKNKQENLKRAIAELQDNKHKVLAESNKARKELENKDRQLQKTRQRLEGIAKEREQLNAELSKLKSELKGHGPAGFLKGLISNYREKIQKLEDLREQKEKLTEKKRREEKLRQESEQKKESKKSSFDEFLALLNDTKKLVESDEIPKAKEIYMEAREIYINLSIDEKKKVYSQLMDVYKKLGKQ